MASGRKAAVVDGLFGNTRGGGLRTEWGRVLCELILVHILMNRKETKVLREKEIFRIESE